MERGEMKANCQGFYRDTVKYLIGVYLHNGMVDKAADQWKALVQKMDEYVLLCQKINAMDKEIALQKFGRILKSRFSYANYPEKGN